MTLFYSKEQVNDALKEVMEAEAQSGLYAPLIKRIRFYIDDEIPPAERKNLRNSNHAPMAASTDKMCIFIDRDYLWEAINQVSEMYIKRHKMFPHQVGYDTLSLREEIRNIYIHELTHTLCQHTHQGLKFFNEKGYIDKEGKGSIPKREYTAWMMACEVEANRGYGIKYFHSAVYDAGVTDRNTYPKTLDKKYLRDIYEQILKDSGEQLEKDFEKAVKLAKKMIEQGEKEEQQQSQNGGNSDGQKGNGSEKDQQDGEGDTSGDANSEDNKGKGQGGEKSEQGSNGTNGSQNTSGDSNDQDGDSSDADTETDEDKKRVENLAKAMLDSSTQLCERIFDPDFDAHDNNIPISDGLLGQAGGIGGGGIDVSGKTVGDALLEYENNYRPQVIERALAHLKGSIVGTIARERVSTYSRQSRKDSSDGLLKKGTKRGARSIPKILVALDKSGSMSSTTTKQATEALAKIFDVTGRPTQGCWICLHDGRVKDVRPFRQWKSVVNGFYPSGGNDFSDVVRRANRLGVDVVLNVGDGGDRVCRDKDATKEFVKAGRRWIDVNITKGSRDWLSGWVIGVYRDDGEKGIFREWADLTGVLEVDQQAIKDWVKNKKNN